MTLIVASQVLSWLAIIVLGIAVVALARQVGVLHERIAPVGALTLGQGPGVGEAAPEMELATLNMGSVRIGAKREAASSQLLMFVSPDCPICKHLIPVARSFATEERLAVIFVSDGDIGAQRRMIEKFDLQAIPFAHSPELGMRFGVAKLPYAVLLDREGKVAATGLVNTREHLESLVVAHETGLPSVQAYLQKRNAAARGVSEHRAHNT
jgi:methylamine dehydrogenase accessory protein MauD